MHLSCVCVCVQVTNTKQILEDVKQEAMTRPAVLRGFGVAGVAGVTQLG
jgi:bacterioferritin-associated ferredoxin